MELNYTFSVYFDVWNTIFRFLQKHALPGFDIRYYKGKWYILTIFLKLLMDYIVINI